MGQRSCQGQFYNTPKFIGRQFREVGSYLNIEATFIDCDFTLLDLTDIPLSGSCIHCQFNRTIFRAAGIVEMNACSFVD